MNAESKPNTRELLRSWHTLWTHQLSGKPAQQKQAMEDHKALFPNGLQSDAVSRAQKLLKDVAKDPEAVRVLIRRIRETLRKV